MMTLLQKLAQPKWRLLRWLLAVVAAISIHAVVIALFLWQPSTALDIAPAAAPQMFQVSMVAAPKSTMVQERVEPQQAAVEKVQKTVSAAPQEVVQTVEPLSDIASDFSLQAIEEPSVHSEEELTEVSRDEPAPAVNERVEEQDTIINEAAAAQQPQVSSAQSLSQSEEAEQISAPQVGALNEVDAQAVVNWKNSLAAHLERRKRYPRAAQIRGQQGVPWVSFTMDRQGNVLNVLLHRPSGVAILDREVLALVKRAQPLPVPPESAPESALAVTVPVAFFIQ